MMLQKDENFSLVLLVREQLAAVIFNGEVPIGIVKRGASVLRHGETLWCRM